MGDPDSVGAPAVEDRLRCFGEALERAPDAHLVADGRLSVRSANAAAAALLGRPVEALLGVDLRSLLVGSAVGDVGGDLFDEVLAGTPLVAGRAFDWHVVREDGRAVPVRVAASPVDSVAPGWVHVHLADVSAEQRAHGALADSERKFRVLVDASPICIHEIDLDGRLVSMNRAGLSMIGSTQSEICGLEYLAFVDEDSRDRVEQLLERAIGGETHFFDFQVDAPDGPLVFASCFAPILDEHGAVQRLMGITEDITRRVRADEERAQVELQLLEAQKLESLGLLAGGIAHDFSNILMGVLGNASLALEEVRQPEVRVNVEAIEVSATRAAELCRQLLAYAGKGRFDVRPLDLSALVTETRAMLGVSVSKDAQVTYDLAEDLPAVEVDPVQLRQIVMNLVINASDALGPGGGEIRVSTAASTETRTGDGAAEARRTGEYVQLEIADTGTGMDAETRARIFDPFFTTKATGRGLGLAATLGAVRSHGGRLECESVLGEGTTMRVLLPASTAEVAPVQLRSNATRTPRGSGLALVVDDEQTVRDVASSMLRRLGYDVLCVPNGSAALELQRARGDDLKLVLLDLVMPGMNGEEVFAALRARARDLPILISSGFDEQEANNVHRDDVAAAFIQKPYRQSDLAARIAEVMGAP